MPPYSPLSYETPEQKDSPLFLVVEIILGLLLILFGILGGIALVPINDSDLNEREAYLSSETDSLKTDSFDSLNTETSDPSANSGEDIPANYGIDSVAFNSKGLLTLSYNDVFFNSFSLASTNLVLETLSDYFSLAYPAMTSLEFDSSSTESSLILISDIGKTFTVNLSSEPNENNRFIVKSLEILSKKGEKLLEYDGKFFDSSRFDAEEAEYLELLNSDGDIFDDIFEEIENENL